jgi:NADH:ubiquinone oxidoreductase subunit E
MWSITTSLRAVGQSRTSWRRFQVVSRNLVELVRRHHEQGAPTALEVLKEAMDQRGEITDDDRRVAAERSGLPEAAIYGISTFYDDLLVPRGKRHVRVCTGTACFAATADAHVETVERALGLKLGERSDDRETSLGETVCLGYCHASPAVRDGDIIDAGPGAVERLLSATTRPAPEPRFTSVAAPASRPAPSGSSRPAPRASTSTSWPTATRATRAPTSTSC